MENLNKCTFLFGAGVSVSAGCYTSGKILRDILTTVKSTSVESSREKYVEAFQSIARIILASIDYQTRLMNVEIGEDYYTANIEDFLRILRKLMYKDYLIPRPLVGNWSDEIFKLEIVYGAKIFDQFLEFILDQLKTKWLKIDEVEANKLLTSIQLFLTKIPADKEIKLHFFSLNYDLLFEKVFNNGAETIVNNGFSKNGFNKSEYETSMSRINYYKLHGSLDWSRTIDGKVVCDSDHSVQDDPVIIFGEDNKMMSFDPFFSLLVSFRNRLDESDLFVVIGYSFQDAYINNLLMQTVNEGQKKMLIIEPFAFGDDKSSPSEINADFLKRLEIVQRTKEHTGMDNLSFKLSEERFEILRITASKFFDDYFKNSANKLVSYIDNVTKDELPFD